MFAAPASAADLTVTNAWIRALPANLPDGGYFTIRNSGPRDVALTGAQSPACGMLMLHKSSDTSGMDTMSDMESVPVPAGATVSFAPGGYHLMCMDPKPAIKPGAKVPVALQFDNGTSLAVTFAVKNARGK
jgi:copper(I)-binding protein